MEFTGSATISASDDGGGGDASAFITRNFTVAEQLFFSLDATLGGNGFPDETAGRVELGLAGSPTPSFSRTTPGSDSFGGVFAPGEYTITAEVGCSPDFDGGTCTGDFSFSLEIGDLIGP